MSTHDLISRKELEGAARLTRVESFNGKSTSTEYLGRLEYGPRIGSVLVLDRGGKRLPMITSTIVSLYECDGGTMVETMNSRYLLTYLVRPAKS